MKKSKKRGSKKPYTNKQMRKLVCYRCDMPAKYQWNICADGLYHPLCVTCDVFLNDMVLKWMGHPDRETLMANYREIA